MSSEPVSPGDMPVLGELLDTAPCGFLSFGDSGTVELANATLLDMLGYEYDEVIGHDIRRILTIGSRLFYQTHWFPLLRMQHHAEEIYLSIRARAGEEIGVLANAVRRERADGARYDCILLRVRERAKYEGELLRARRVAEQARTELERAGKELEAKHVELLEQAEELKRSRAAAQQANQAKSTFLATMSHELRTPLNAITGYVQLLQMELHGPITGAQREALERIDLSQRHLLGLINDVLNLSRIEAGRVEYDMADVSVGDIIEHVLPMVEPQLADKGLSLRVSVPAGENVHADREKAQQIVLNLLSNAVKFTPAGGVITVEAVRRDEAPASVLLMVRDTGAGIPADMLEAVFEPFLQLDAGEAQETQGSGLGLAISRDLARGMGGDLRAESVEGCGSTFILSLPSSGNPVQSPDPGNERVSRRLASSE